MLDIVLLRDRKVEVNDRGTGRIRGGYIRGGYLLFLVEFTDGSLGEYYNNQLYLIPETEK